MTTRFRTDRSGIAEISRSAQLADVLHDVAEDVAQEARVFAPVLTGGYRDEIDTDTGVEGVTLIARVNANFFTSWFIEAGTVDTPTFAPLRRAAEALGLDLKE